MCWTVRAIGLVLVLALAACGGDESTTATYDQVSAWLTQLCEDDAALRERAAEALGTAWPDGARAVPVLAEALGDEAPGVRAAAATSLQALGRQGVHPLLAFLRDEDDPSRGGLLKVVGTLRSLGANLTPKNIADYMQSEPRGGLVFWGLGVGVLGGPFPANLANRFPLGFLGTCADAVRRAPLGIEDPKWPGTAAAVCAVSGMLALGPSETRDVPEGILALRDDADPDVQSLGGLMLSTWSARRHPEEPATIESHGPMAFESLHRELLRFGSDAPDGPDPDDARFLVAEARRMVPVLEGRQRSKLADALSRALDGPDFRWGRRDAIHLLGLLGEDAAVAVPELVRALEEAEATWQRYMHDGGEEAPAGDLVALQVEYGWTFESTFVNRLFLTDVFGAIGPSAGEAASLLERLAVTGDPTLRYLAARSLRRIRTD